MDNITRRKGRDADNALLNGRLHSRRNGLRSATSTACALTGRGGRQCWCRCTRLGQQSVTLSTLTDGKPCQILALR